MRGGARAHRWKQLVPLLSLLAFVPTTVRANHIPLNYDLHAYLILGLKSTRISTLKIEPGPGCNIGVNCTPSMQARGTCGYLHGKHAVVPAPGQVAANQVCGGDQFYQVFANSVCTEPTCAQIGHAGSKPDCTDPFVGPIIGDLDGDNIPSCDAACVSDPDDVAAACDTLLPLPPCDPLTPVRVNRDEDCSVGDVMPGNGRCDLAAGTYGDIRVMKGARIDFAPGTTVICGLRTQAAVRVTTLAGAAKILVPGTGAVKFNNSVDIGSDCGMLTIVTERGMLKLGRHGDYTLDVCSVAGQLRLGHDNNLKGHYIGDFVSSDKDNDGRCTCNEAIAPATTTSTTSSTTTSTTDTTSTTSTTDTTSTTSTTATTSTTESTTTTSTTTTSTTTSTTESTTTSSTTATTASTTTTSTTSSTTSSTTTSSTSSTTASTAPTVTTETTSTTTSTTEDPSTTTTSTTTTSTTTSTTESTTTSSTTATTASTTTTSTTSSTTSSTTTSSTSSTTASTAPTVTTETTSTTTSTTEDPGTTTTSTTTVPTTSSTTSTTTNTTTSSTTTTSSSTTTTTLAGGNFTRTPGFYKNHPTITQQILTNAGGLVVCGHPITDVDVNHGHSALEALCISVKGEQRAQLLRHLVTAALNMAAGGANYPGYSACNAVCINMSSTTAQLTSCIDQTDTYNQSGDNVTAPWDPPGPADPNPCQAAFGTACTVLSPGPCAAP